ncbi:choice-of-anchor L domain-containing protein [Sulfurimonas sp. SAG-AH-194-I05]|nr:choice-of-anchor L domain-containing protein [Sulfurimonas sp. SAG-AH-194-I05]MDF1874205.1 choice-of-anchor L domain-containing protein [Sulfurimonas sp. SAG-AH-194-I05]
MKSSPFLLIFFLFISTFSHAVTLQTNDFSSSLEGWTGTNVTRELDQMRIDRDDTAQKTFTFADYANQTVTFTLDATEISTWENSDDLEIRVNNNKVIDDTIKGTESKTFTALLDSSGSVTIKIKPNTSKNVEDVYIDNIVVTFSDTTLVFQAGVAADVLAAQIQGIGITITNPVLTHGGVTQGGLHQVGTFSNAINAVGLEIDEGIILTCMDVAESFTTNNSGSRSLTPSGTYHDADLKAIDSNAIYNPVIFEFDVTLDDNTRLLLIDYQFASEEYNEYVASRFNDSFGFFISGGDLTQTYNIARVIDNQTYVTIDNINNYNTVTVNNVNNGTAGYYADGTSWDATKSAFFIDNTVNPKPVQVEYDGLTKTLHATLDNLTPGLTYHFKMALADTGDSQWDSGVFINKINGLREPDICYDYAYKQNDIYLTEGYDPLNGPFINGAVIPNDPSKPLEVSMYFRNTRESEITASNVTVDVLDLNTSQATYKRESVWVIQPQEVFRTKLNDSLLNVSDSFVKNTPINSFNSYEYFYTYFSIDPLVSTLFLPIQVRLNYDLTIPLSQNESVTINRSSLIDAEIPICGGGDSAFDPVYTIFNIIEEEYYTSHNNYNYNINTQVTQREANLAVTTIDANSSDLHTIIDGIVTVVGVDMLDLDAFHDTSASCSEVGNAISDRSWVIINGNGVTPLETNNPDFYKTARKNVALRISYNVSGANDNLLQLESISDNGELRWNVANFDDAVKIGECATDISNGNDMVAQWCSNAGTSFNSAMNKAALSTCMECIYGISTKLTCARDNFAIRPEAFLLNMQDKTVKLTNNYTGVSSPTQARIDLAAGYDYTLDINATTHTNNAASLGYTTSFNLDAGTSSHLKWAPRSGQVTTGCNDTADHPLNVVFINGEAQSTTPLPQVGDYLLHLEDTSWTNIDSIEQSHHSRNYFLSGSDCVLGSSFVAQTTNADSLNGCSINSQHVGSIDSNLSYTDLNLSAHPYKFALTTITPTVGLNHENVNANSYIYMADIRVLSDTNMSYHLNGNIEAQGEDNGTLSNFVNNCYAKPVRIDVNKSTVLLPVAYQYNLQTFNLDGTRIKNNTNDLNNTNNAITLLTADFPQTLEGSARTILNLNYTRETNNSVNPQEVTFNSYNVTCTDALNDCTFNADALSNKTTQGTKDLNASFSIKHYYGRTNIPRSRFQNNTDQSAFIYYEVYCEGNTCNKNLLQNATSSTYIDDPRWFVNTNHSSSFGSAGDVVQKNGQTAVTPDIGPSGNHQDFVRLDYDGTKGNPYKTTMKNKASGWLLYNKYKMNATNNEFEVEFEGTNTQWNGTDAANVTTKRKAADGTNRRSRW